MRKILISIFLLASIYASGKDFKPTKNVILMIADGTSTGVISASRWYQKYMNSEKDELNIDPHFCGYASTFKSNAPIPCSASAMSTIVTGVLHFSGSLSIYPTQDKEHDLYPTNPNLTYQPAVTILEIAQKKGKKVGLVATSDFCHATPAACASHHTKRGAYPSISSQMVGKNLDVVLAGGSSILTDYHKTILKKQGATLIEKDVEAFRNYDGDSPLWALFTDGRMSYDLDREHDEEPSLAQMTKKAIDLLSDDKDGFFLMVEGSKVDWAAHANDAAATITDFLAFDEAVGEAIKFAKADKNTTVIMLSDHGTSNIGFGARDYDYKAKGLEPIFGTISKYTKTAEGITKEITESPAKELRNIFYKNTGIELSKEEEAKINETLGLKEDDYMKISNSRNAISTIAQIMLSHTPFAFMSGSHTGEDVFLAIYNSKDNHPSGRLKNSELHEYMCQLMRTEQDDMLEISKELFNKHTELFEDYKYSIGSISESEMEKLLASPAHSKSLEITEPSKTGIPVLKVELSNSRSLIIPANGSLAYLDGKEISLETSCAYIEENKTFYIAKSIKDQL